MNKFFSNSAIQYFYFNDSTNSGYVYCKTNGELVLQYNGKLMKVQEEKGLSDKEVFYNLYQIKYNPVDPCEFSWGYDY